MFFFSKIIEKDERKIAELNRYSKEELKKIQFLDGGLVPEELKDFYLLQQEVVFILKTYMIAYDHNSPFGGEILKLQDKALKNLYTHLNEGTIELINLIKSEIISKESQVPKETRIKILKHLITYIRLVGRELYHQENGKRSIINKTKEKMYNPYYSSIKRTILSEFAGVNERMRKIIIPLNKENIEKIRINVRYKISQTEKTVKDFLEEKNIQIDKALSENPDLKDIKTDDEYKKDRIRRERTIEIINNLLDVEDILRLLLYIETKDANFINYYLNMRFI